MESKLNIFYLLKIGCVQFSSSNTNQDQQQMDSSSSKLISSATSMAVTAIKPTDQLINDEQSMVQELIGNETDLKQQRKTHYMHHNHTSNRRKHHKEAEDKQITSAPILINSNEGSKQVPLTECSKKYFTDFYREQDWKGNCVSTKKLRLAKCTGSCNTVVDSVQQAGCCKPTRHRTKQVRMKCEDGRSFVKKLNIVRKCSCSLKSTVC